MVDLLHGVGDFFSLDFGSKALRMVQLSGNVKKGWALEKYAYVPIDPKLLMDEGEGGIMKTAAVNREAVKQDGIETKNVAVGLPSSRTFTSIVEIENRTPKELKNTIMYEIDQFVPMAMDEAKVDWASIGTSPNDPSKMEIVVSSTQNNYAEKMMNLVETAGLNVIAQEPEPLAMARALMVRSMGDGQLIVDFGEKVTDLVIVYKGGPRVVRTIAGGLEQLVDAVSTGLAVAPEQARQFILQFGLSQDKVEGQVFKALDTSLNLFAQELGKSIRFFQSKYMGAKVGGITAAGFGTVVPLFAEYIEAKTGVTTLRGNPWQSVRMTSGQQSALAPVASEFAVAVGLAERSNE